MTVADTLAGLTPEQLKVLVTALKEDAERLGLIWTRRFGTVITTPSNTTATVLMDSATVSSATITCVSLVPVRVGSRVVVDSIPPAGKFIVGTVLKGIKQEDTGSWSCATAAAASATCTISFNTGVTFDAAPTVLLNIISTAGASQFFMSRAINITTTGFTVWIVNVLNAASTTTILGQYHAILLA